MSDKLDPFNDDKSINENNDNDNNDDNNDNDDDNDDKNNSSSKDLDLFEKEIDELFSESQTIITRLRKLKNRIPKLKTMYKKLHKKIENTGTKKMTGIFKDKKLPDELASLLEIEKGTMMNNVEITSAVIKYLKKEKLYYNKNKQVYRANSKIIKIFNLSLDVNNKTDPRDKDSLSIYTINKLVAQYLKNQENK